MKRKIFALVFAAVLFCSSGAKAQWVHEQSPVNENLNAVYFTDMNTGWTVGDNGTILKYASGRWSIYKSPTGNDLYSVMMLSDKEGWIVGEEGTILRFNGFRWEPVQSPTVQDLYSVSFYGPESGIAVGAMGVVLQYDRQGWRLVSEDYRIDLYAVAFNNHQVWTGGYTEGISVPMMKLETGYDDGSAEIFAIELPVKSLSMPDAFTGWAVGSRNEFLRFDGSSWERVRTSGQFAALRSVFFKDEYHGISAGYSGTILLYANGKWNKEVPITDKRLNATFIIGNKYFVAGNSGTILTKTTSPAEGSAEKSVTVGNEFSIFPNPGDQHVNLFLPLNRNTGEIQVSIRDVTGKAVKSLVFEMAGEEFLTLPTSDLRDGVYFISVDAGNKSDTKQLIIHHGK